MKFVLSSRLPLTHSIHSTKSSFIPFTPQSSSSIGRLSTSSVVYSSYIAKWKSIRLEWNEKLIVYSLQQIESSRQTLHLLPYVPVVGFVDIFSCPMFGECPILVWFLLYVVYTRTKEIGIRFLYQLSSLQLALLYTSLSLFQYDDIVLFLSLHRHALGGEEYLQLHVHLRSEHSTLRSWIFDGSSKYQEWTHKEGIWKGSSYDESQLYFLHSTQYSSL